MSVSAAAKTLGITDQTYYRWRARYGSMPEDEAKRLQVLDEENARLKRVITEQSLDVSMLQDLTQGEILERGATAGGGGLPGAPLPHLRTARLPARRTAPVHPALRHEPAGTRTAWRTDRPSKTADFDEGFPSSGPGPGPGPGAPGWEVPTQGWRSTLIERETETEDEFEAEAEERCRSWRTGAEEGRLLRAVEEPDDTLHGPTPRAAKIPFLEGRIRCVRRLRTSVLHDVVWLARDSETARLFGADAVIFGLQDLAATPRRLVHLFREDDEETLGSTGH